jgi:hypothetical protein
MRGGKPSVTLEILRKLGNEATFHTAIFRKVERSPHRQLVRTSSFPLRFAPNVSSASYAMIYR